jgi:hypothetical protein
MVERELFVLFRESEKYTVHTFSSHPVHLKFRSLYLWQDVILATELSQTLRPHMTQIFLWKGNTTKIRHKTVSF